MIGNELADGCAKGAAAVYSMEEQDTVCASLSNLKSNLRTSLMNNWKEKMSEAQQQPSFRESILQDRTSQLKLRVSSPRPFQTLFSRYRCNRTESCGEYAFKLKYTNDRTCRLCGAHRETLAHLLNECYGTRAICSDLNLSTLTLTNESPSNMRKVASFDRWIREHTTYNNRPPANRIIQTLQNLEEEEKKKRVKRELDNDDVPSTKRVKRDDSINPDSSSKVGSKRKCLVIPDNSLYGTIRTKVRRISTEQSKG